MSLSREEQLIDAAKEGDLATIKRLIETDAKLIHYKADYSRTALFHAAWHNRRDVVAFLRENGADINIKTYRNTTPISAAADYGHLETVKYLIEHKANIDLANDANKTPLIRAVESEAYDIKTSRHHLTIKALVENKANLNTQDKYGKTALMYAKCPETFTLILEAKADIELKDKEGQTVLLKLCADDNDNSLIKIQNLINKNVNVNAADLKDHSAIDCVLNGSAPDKLALEKLKLLFATDKVNPDFITKLFSTALTPKPAPRLHLLKPLGCKPQFKSRLELLTYSYNTNSFDECYASLSTLEAKEDITTKNAFSLLLIKAIHEGKFHIASRLVKFSNLKIRDEKGKSIFELTLQNERYKYSENQLNLVKEIINALEDLEQVDEKGDSLLMRTMGNSVIALFLIEKGVNLKVVSKNGDTPLIRAATTSKEKIVKAILDRHTENIDAKNKENRTALFIAGFRLYDGETYQHAEVIKHLLCAKANPDIECTDAWEYKTNLRALSNHDPLKKLFNLYEPKIVVAPTDKSFEKLSVPLFKPEVKIESHESHEAPPPSYQDALRTGDNPPPYTVAVTHVPATLFNSTAQRDLSKDDKISAFRFP